MSFASQTKKELTLIDDVDECCMIAELSALIRMNGTVQITNRKVVLDISTENAAIARRIYSLIKKTFALPLDLLVRKKMRLKKNNVYIIRLPVQVQDTLQRLRIVAEGFQFHSGIDPAIYQKHCCKRAYLRGAF